MKMTDCDLEELTGNGGLAAVPPLTTYNQNTEFYLTFL